MSPLSVELWEYKCKQQQKQEVNTQRLCNQLITTANEGIHHLFDKNITNMKWPSMFFIEYTSTYNW